MQFVQARLRVSLVASAAASVCVWVGESVKTHSQNTPLPPFPPPCLAARVPPPPPACVGRRWLCESTNSPPQPTTRAPGRRAIEHPPRSCRLANRLALCLWVSPPLFPPHTHSSPTHHGQTENVHRPRAGRDAGGERVGGEEEESEEGASRACVPNPQRRQLEFGRHERRLRQLRAYRPPPTRLRDHPALTDTAGGGLGEGKRR